MDVHQNGELQFKNQESMSHKALHMEKAELGWNQVRRQIALSDAFKAGLNFRDSPKQFEATER